MHPARTAALAVLVGACAQRPASDAPAARPKTAGEGMTTTTGADRGAAEPRNPLEVDAEAVERLASSLCRRASVCEEVGPGRRYANSDACLVQARRRARQRMEQLDCPVRKEAKGVERCVRAVRTLRCSSSLDDPLDMRTCGRARVCERP
jgi:uncharacterized protein DUF6184